MDAKTLAHYDARAKIIRAMGHSTRLFIVDELSKSSEKCVHELTELVGTEMSTVSRHLSVLRAAGIVEDEKRGAQIYYRLATRCILQLFRCVDAVMKRNAHERRKSCE